MKEPLAKFQAGMNLILITSLLLAFSIFRKSPDVLKLGLTIWNQLRNEKFYSVVRDSVTIDRPYPIPEVEYAQLKRLEKQLIELSSAKSDMIHGLYPMFFSRDSSGNPHWSADKVPRAIRLARLNRLGVLEFLRLRRMLREFKLDLTSAYLITSNKIGKESLAVFRGETSFVRMEHRVTMPVDTLLYEVHLDSTIVPLIEKLDELNGYFVEAGFKNADITFKQLNDKLLPKVKVPFVEQEVTTSLAVFLLGTLLIGPYVYLLSLCSAIQPTVQLVTNSEGIEFLFFQPGKLGFTIGMFYLAGPLGVIIWGGIIAENFNLGHPLIIGLLLTLLLLGTFLILKVIKLRAKFHQRLYELKVLD